jgi:16S rRNA (uracil1498-N3)-methyltransferase
VSSLYFNPELDPAAEIGGTARIIGAEARHAVTVGRARVGEQLSIGNGSGLVVTGSVTAATPTELTIDIGNVSRETLPTPALVLVQALAKGDRDELAVQAATELGVDAVVPWSASRSVSRWEGPKIAKGEERWRAIVREAAKQSIRAWVPEVGPLTTTKQLASLAQTSRVIVLDPLAETPLSALVSDGRDIMLVVGPEGGIAPSEFEALTSSGAERAKLGDSILRTSTAGPAAIAVLSAKLGRW